ncbi:ABC transporter permease [Ornithinimicrobium pekingense]|uniref:ABC transporter permease n=1 Tax=Ornithinimicrobium pekingense TaxID=384677 RepID=A0ABQ2F2V0_9MICO|nr:ABC transporter permease [Ornithinimicrobium pekingense]GGK56699.1 ABC transporter permease [Ornithinimicrobium pekingense]
MSTTREHPDVAPPQADRARVPDHPSVTPPRAPWTLVMAREIRVRLTDKTFVLGTVLTVVLLLGAMVVPALLGGGGTEYRVAVTDATGAALVERAAPAVSGAPSMSGQEEVTVLTEPVADRSAAEDAVVEGDADVALVGADGAWEVLSDGEPPLRLTSALADTVRAEALAANAEQAGTSMAELTAGTVLTTVDVGSQDGAMAEGMLFVVGLGFAMVFYIAALMFGMQIASSVVEEKQSRIVEILAAAIPVRHLLLGKVLGNTLMAVGQMALIVAAALVGLTFTDLDVALPGMAEALGWYLPFFLLGFLALACVWAAAGALASRTEDLQSTTMPLTMVLVVAIFGAINLDGVWREVASFVPVLSTLLMPMRILEGDVSWWEPALALALVAGFCALTILLGSRLYRRALLHTSGSLTWRRALRMGE